MKVILVIIGFVVGYAIVASASNSNPKDVGICYTVAGETSSIECREYDESIYPPYAVTLRKCTHNTHAMLDMRAAANIIPYVCK